MDFYRQGAMAALQLFKVANILETRLGRRMVSNALQTVINPEHKPRLVRTLEPYYESFVLGDPDAFKRFDAQAYKPPYTY